MQQQHLPLRVRGADADAAAQHGSLRPSVGRGLAHDRRSPSRATSHSTSGLSRPSATVCLLPCSCSLTSADDYTFECARSRLVHADGAATFSAPTAPSRSRSRPRATCGDRLLGPADLAQIQSAYWPAANGESGYRINEALSGSMHGAPPPRQRRADVAPTTSCPTRSTLTSPAWPTASPSTPSRPCRRPIRGRAARRAIR